MKLNIKKGGTRKDYKSFKDLKGPLYPRSVEDVRVAFKMGIDFSKIDMTTYAEDVRKGNIELIEVLVRYGANINYQNNEGETLLSRSVYNMPFQNMISLLQLGADPNKGAVIDYGWYKGRLSVVEYYMTSSSDITFDMDQSYINALRNHGAIIEPNVMERLDSIYTGGGPASNPKMRKWVNEITKDANMEAAPVDAMPADAQIEKENTQNQD